MAICDNIERLVLRLSALTLGIEYCSLSLAEFHCSPKVFMVPSLSKFKTIGSVAFGNNSFKMFTSLHAHFRSSNPPFCNNSHAHFRSSNPPFCNNSLTS
ncbi:hypothetical protein QE152_g35994 [Popillia japonica]|uniref:Uncharacterized protein n=1 Tax=Popillia japonica TaxID=7064 RepID=A0AAW1IDQ0_POPJA